jgi:hypothetical protein
VDQFPQIPNNLLLVIGLAVVLFVYKIFSSYAEEVGRRIFRLNPKKRRDYDQPNWFREYMDHHDKLVEEIHGFAEKMTMAVEMSNNTSNKLDEHINRVQERHMEIIKDLQEINTFHKKMPQFQCQFKEQPL